MAYINNNEVLFSAQVNGLVDIDDTMSDTSENPVQNKAVKSYVDKSGLRLINKIELGTGDTAEMLSITKDKDGNDFELNEIFFTVHCVFDAVASGNCAIRIRTDGGQRYMVIKSGVSLSNGLITCSGAVNAHNGILSTTAVYSTVDNPQQSDTMYGMIAKANNINYDLKNIEAFIIFGSGMVQLKEGSFIEMWGC